MSRKPETCFAEMYYAGKDNAHIRRRNKSYLKPTTESLLRSYKAGYRAGIKDRKAEEIFGEAASW